jgi:hypothetical protein
MYPFEGGVVGGSLRGAAFSGLCIIWIQFLTKGRQLMTMLNTIKFMLQLVNSKSAVDVADS